MTKTHADPDAPLQDRITARLAGMTRAERQVAEYLRTHGRKAIYATAGQIAAAAGTSDATVVRTARTLGYANLLELRLGLAEQVVRAANPSVPDRDDEASGPRDQTRMLLDHLFDEAVERIHRTRRLLEEPAFDRAVEALAAAREVMCFGVGPSQTVADYCALRLRRIGHRARATGATGFRLADDLLGLGDGDVVVLYSPARLLGEIEVIVRHVREVGARAVLVTDSLGELFAGRVHVVLPAVHSTSNITGETIASQVVTDALLLGVAARDEARAVGASELMTSLRSELIQADSREFVPRRHRGDRASGDPR